MPKTYVISDLHLGHMNIIKFERTEFKSIQDHDAFLIKTWNSVVQNEDTVYVLGDVSLCIPKEDVSSKIHQLHGTKILVRGNHDHSTDTYYKDVGFSQVFTGPIFIKQGKIILSHEPAKEALNNEFVINIYGHLHNSYLNLKNFITVSAKMVHYTPQNIDQLLGEYEKTNGPLSDRSEDFTEEWYAPYVVQTEGQWAGKTPDQVRQDFRKMKYDRRMAYEAMKKSGKEN